MDLWFVGDEHGDNPTYPPSGLCWDIREPYDSGYKVWKIDADLFRQGYQCDIIYNFDPFGGYPLPDGWIARLDTDGEINADNYLDLSLYEYDLGHQGESGHGYVIIETIEQTGEVETWYIIAGIPEPPLAQAVALIFGLAWVVRRTRRR